MYIIYTLCFLWLLGVLNLKLCLFSLCLSFYHWIEVCDNLHIVSHVYFYLFHNVYTLFVQLWFTQSVNLSLAGQCVLNYITISLHKSV